MPDDLIKGETSCNREACQLPLLTRSRLRWWNTSTRAWYCRGCAVRINRACVDDGKAHICFEEGSAEFNALNAEDRPDLYPTAVTTP